MYHAYTIHTNGGIDDSMHYQVTDAYILHVIEAKSKLLMIIVQRRSREYPFRLAKKPKQQQKFKHCSTCTHSVYEKAKLSCI